MTSSSSHQALPALHWPARVLSGVYGLVLIAIGVVAPRGQLEFLTNGCVTCWVALVVMASLVVVGLTFLWVAARPRARDS